VSFDGTRLTSHAAGDPEAPALLLCGGLGGGVGIWRPLFERLARDYHIVSWDYRGLYASEPAADARAYSLPVHARDLLELLKQEGIESPVLAGWSMGVQVALEVHREAPDLAAGLVLLHGTAGRPLDTAFDSALSARVSPWVLAGLRLVGTRFAWVGPSLTRVPQVVGGFVRASQRLGLMAAGIDVAGFRDMAEEWTRLHLGIYARIFHELGEHDASDLLEGIRAPALVIAGGADRLTPPSAAERMAEALPNARFEVVPEATHFGLLEFPDEILDRVERFLREQRVEPPGDPREVSSGA
jgi:pimeloyl-ACP methyl ester carboxylesterase